MYAVFWTRIINETAKPFELTINFPADSIEISPDHYLEIFLPADTMTTEKRELFSYGLSVSKVALQKELKRTIHPKDSGAFYVLTLATRPVNGTLRTQLSLKGQDLFYKMNDKEIFCGKMNVKGLIPVR